MLTMNLFDKIEKIRIENKLGVADFLEKTGYSRTSYYAVRDGRSSKLTAKSAEKIISISKKYTLEWLMETDNTLSNNAMNKESFLEKEGVKIEIEEIIGHIIKNEEAYFDNKIFKLWFNDHINQAMKKICEENGIKITYTSK